MKLLKYENFQVLPTEEAMLVKPIRDLYNKDKSKTKESFMQQISYMFHMIDPRSSYYSIEDVDDKKAQIIEQEGLPKDFKPSEQLLKAMDIYEKLIITPSAKALKSMLIHLDKIRDFIEKVDLFATDDKGRPIFSADRVAATVDKLPSITKKITEAQKMVEAEIIEVGRARGGNETKALFEDGI